MGDWSQKILFAFFALNFHQFAYNLIFVQQNEKKTPQNSVTSRPLRAVDRQHVIQFYLCLSTNCYAGEIVCRAPYDTRAKEKNINSKEKKLN